MALQSSSSLRSPPPRRAKALIPGSEGHQGTSREGSKRRGVTRKYCKGPERGLCFVGHPRRTNRNESFQYSCLYSARTKKIRQVNHTKVTQVFPVSRPANPCGQNIGLRLLSLRL